MNFVYKEYKGITFPLRDCTFTHNGNEIRRLIGSDIVSDILFNEHKWRDDEAEFLDSEIQYFISHDLLFTLSDDEILKYIYEYVDGEIYDDFNF